MKATWLQTPSVYARQAANKRDRRTVSPRSRGRRSNRYATSRLSAPLVVEGSATLLFLAQRHMKHPNGGLSPYEQRFGVAFNGPLLAFGSEVSYKSAVSEPNGPGNKFGPSSKQGVIVGYYTNPGGVWSKDYVVFDLESVRDNNDCRRIRTRRCGAVFQKRGAPHFPMLTMEAQGNLVPPLPVVPKPEVLQLDVPAAPGEAPAEAEAAKAPASPIPPAMAKPPVKVEVEKMPLYKAGQFVDPAAFDEARVPKGHRCEDARITRVNRTDSKRPASIWPEMWAIMTPKEKIEARQAATPYIASVTMVRKKYVLKMPCMPTKNSDSKWVHREKLSDDFGLGGLAAVARSVKPKELKLNKKALAAMEKEWSALREVGAWDEKRVREWTDVREEAKKKGIRMHVGMVFGICVEKLPSFPRAARGENTQRTCGVSRK